jgi:hypothetical protein
MIDSELDKSIEYHGIEYFNLIQTRERGFTLSKNVCPTTLGIFCKNCRRLATTSPHWALKSLEAHRQLVWTRDGHKCTLNIVT